MPINQSGLLPAPRGRTPYMRSAGGICVRGVVIDSYYPEDVIDERFMDGKENRIVTCDVLTYGSKYKHFFKAVPVIGARHGVNDHHTVWIPRPTQVDMSTGEYPVYPTTEDGTSTEIRGNPVNFDGDHVLLEFMENDPQQPFIRSSLPHPRAVYRMERDSGEKVRTQFRGTSAEIDERGNVRVATEDANSGTINPTTGEETPQNDGGHGNIFVTMPTEGTLEVLAPDGLTRVFAISIHKDDFKVELDSGEALFLTGADDNTFAVIGDGAVSVAIADYLRTLWQSMETIFNTHTHISAASGSATGTPTASLPPLTAPSWDPNIESLKLNIPDN